MLGHGSFKLFTSDMSVVVGVNIVEDMANHIFPAFWQLNFVFLGPDSNNLGELILLDGVVSLSGFLAGLFEILPLLL